VSNDFSSANARLQRALDPPHSQSEPARAHIRTVQAQVEAIARGDYPSVLATATPDVTLDIFAPPEFGWILQGAGVEELRRALEHNFGSVANQRPEVTDVFAEGNDVVLFGRERGIVRTTGRAYDVEFVERFTFRDGQLARVRIIAAHRSEGE
jgi:ketosteroid isomerase-like protein